MRWSSGILVLMLAATLGAIALALVPSRSDQAWFLLHDGDAEAALVAAEAALDQAPTDERAAWVLALIQTHLGLTEATEATLRQRVENTDRSAMAVHDLARHLRSMGRPQEAIDLFRAVPVRNLAPDEHSYVAGWLRVQGDVAAQLRFLGALWSERMLDGAAAQHYAALLAVSGDRETSLRVYRTLDNDGLLANPIARLQFEALLQQRGSAD